MQPFHPLSSPSPPALSLSQLRVFSNESAFHIRWPKYWSFSISPSNEYSRLISFRIDWFVQGTKPCCPRDSQESSPASQFKNINSSALSLFYGSNPYVDPYVTTGETIALTTWTFVGKVTSLVYNMQSTFVIDFFTRKKHLLISLQQSSPTVILEPKKIKSVTTSIFSPSICHEVM